MRGTSSWFRARFTHCLFTGALTAAIATAVAQTRPMPALRAADSSITDAEQRAALASIQSAFISIADSVEPTVVTIDATERPKPKPDADRHAPPSKEQPRADG